jgi:hypothetical protein
MACIPHSPERGLCLEPALSAAERALSAAAAAATAPSLSPSKRSERFTDGNWREAARAGRGAPEAPGGAFLPGSLPIVVAGPLAPAHA